MLSIVTPAPPLTKENHWFIMTERAVVSIACATSAASATLLRIRLTSTRTLADVTLSQASSSIGKRTKNALRKPTASNV